MSRIRTIKPDFFKHEDLFDAEHESGLPLRLAFAGLWTCCDREGRFEWRPRALKTDILPYDDIDFSKVMDALADRGFVVRYEVDGKPYGFVPSFTHHQIINNRESESKLPPPPVPDAPSDAGCDAFSDACATRHGNYNGEREGEGESNSEANASGASAPQPGDPVKELFDAGVRVLGACDVAAPKARTMIGKWRKQHPGQDGEILSAIMDCGRAGAVDPIPWIEARLRPKPSSDLDALFARALPEIPQ